MKKSILLFALLFLSFCSYAQITTYNHAARNDFYGIGGYSFSQRFFTSGVRPNPDMVTGPSPQNDFTYTVSAEGGIQHNLTNITTLSVNKSITIQFKGNNVRKFGCRATAVNIPTGQGTAETLSFLATTNLGNTATQTATSADFVGFNVTGGENEYIVSVIASFVNPSTNSIAINQIMVGDNTPQNVALNFDGVDDYVSIPSTVGNFDTGQDFTVSCWIKPDPNQSSPNGQFYANENDIITKRNDVSASVSDPYPFEIRYLNNNRTNPAERNRIRAGQWDGTNFPFITSTTPLNDGMWHHVAFVRESGNFKLYIDGVQEGSTVADNATDISTNASALQIGRRANNQNFFKGEIDEVRIWNIGKTATQIANERFCKRLTNTTNLQASYNFSNGVPHDNNPLITQIQDAVSTNHGTLNNFAQNGDVSNFVTGQVKYVKKPNFGTINGSSWATAFIDLQSALTANTCNDLFDVYVAKQTYLPTVISDKNTSFIIPSGMSIYGGFAGNEKSINQRNRALIHSTNQTTLSGDLSTNDNPFNFTTGRTENSNTVIKITGDKSVLDGFTVRAASLTGINMSGTNSTIRHCRVIDNSGDGFKSVTTSTTVNGTIANCSISGNGLNGISLNNSFATIKESIVANNLSHGISIILNGFTLQTTITNCTITSNAFYGILAESNAGTSNNTLKNTILFGNATGGIISSHTATGRINTTVTYSLVQGITTGTGNLNGNTVNPQFVNPLATTVISDAGDYRLKWCSRAIGTGNNTGISPLDLDRNPRNFNGTADMGAYEFLGNTSSQVNNSTISGTIDSPIYAGGAVQTITSTAKILAPAGAIDFKAPNSITLNPGFEARGMNSYFKAEIGANQTCVN